MLDTLVRVLVFFGFIGLGVALVRFKRLNAQGLDGLSAYFYWLGFPAWLMVSFSRLSRFDGQTAMTLLVYIAAMLTGALVIALIVRLCRQPQANAVGAGMASLINNSAFLGIPIALSLFGPEAGRIGPLVVAADFLVLFSTACAALAKASGQTFLKAMLNTARNPTVIGALTGVVLMILGLRFPPPVENALDLLGRSGPPVALVALGGMLGLMEPRFLIRADITSGLAIVGKILLAPALVAIALGFLHLAPETYKVCVFLSATPTAVSVFIQTKMYGTWFEGAAKTVAQGTTLSVLTLSALAVILTHLT
ncbi:AEC family transporter [Asticcacaulis solisilvae]|uniref:AEC family transporter n=1 Tax=Asticcacaulis solisilvae TaxID=1217274 RepID=UPI003FD8AFB1